MKTTTREQWKHTYGTSRALLRRYGGYRPRDRLDMARKLLRTFPYATKVVDLLITGRPNDLCLEHLCMPAEPDPLIIRQQFIQERNTLRDEVWTELDIRDGEWTCPDCDNSGTYGCHVTGQALWCSCMNEVITMWCSQWPDLKESSSWLAEQAAQRWDDDNCAYQLFQNRRRAQA